MAGVTIRPLRLWLRQTQALVKKILLITLTRHWLSTLIRSIIIPTLALSLILGIQKFTSSGNKYGTGTSAPAQTLADFIPAGAKFFFVQPSNSAADISAAIEDIKRPLGNKARIETVQTEEQLVNKCPTNINGVTDCYAAIVFNDSPLSSAGSRQWNYTLRISSLSVPSSFDVGQSHVADWNPYMPLQLAVDQAITNSTDVPDTYLFTRTTENQAAALHRREFLNTVISGLGIICFASMLSHVFHIVGMIAAERESGMAQLIDVMGGGAASARVLSFVIAFDIIYLPAWIILGGVYSALLLPTTSAGIPILWQVLTGWALTSGCVFGATFAVRYSAIYATVALVGIAAFAQLLDTQTEPISATVTVIFSFIFPSCSYIFVLNSLARYEQAGLPANIYTIPPSGGGPELQQATIGTLWAYLCLTIVSFPLLAIFVEKYIHGISSRRRSFKTDEKSSDASTALEINGLVKTYRQSWWRRLCCCCCGDRKSRTFTAVDSLDFSSQKSQILCLLGINGSGKTTTMDLITGRQSITSGSISFNASASQIGFCPQRNIQWDVLTVLEHVALWDMIKGGSATQAELEDLVKCSDLGPKMHSRVGTLSGGQKRKVQLACMLAGGSSVCLMDEVTTGMDPVSRRAIWNIVLAERSKRSIIFTTHFLDECEVLADQVVVLVRGQNKCQGSPAELKNTYGEGYRVHLPDVGHVPETGYPRSVHQGTTSFHVPTSQAAIDLLAHLEGSGLSGISITGPTIEDVFLRVAKEPDGPSRSYTHMSSTSDTAPLTASGVDEQLSEGSTTTFLQQLSALALKRIIILRSSFWFYVMAMALPLVFSPAITSMLIVSNGPDTFPFELPKCTSFEPSIFDAPFLVDLPVSGYTDALGSMGVSVLVGPQAARSDVFNVVDKFPLGIRYDSNKFDADFTFQDGRDRFQNVVKNNATNFGSGAIFVGDGSQKAVVAVNPELGQDVAVLMQNLWRQAKSRIPIAVNLAYFTKSVPADAGAGLIAAILLTFLHSLYPAIFALYPAYEKIQKVRALQYSNNVSPYPLWASYIVVDMSIVTIVAALGTLALAAHVPNWYFAGYMFPVMWLFGITGMLWSYIISLYSRSELQAFGLTVCLMVVFYFLSVVGFSLSATNPDPRDPNIILDAVSYALGLIFPAMNLFRAMAIGLNVWLVGCRQFKLITDPGSINAYGGPIMLLVIQVVYLLPLLIWLDGQKPISWPWQRKTVIVSPEDAVSSMGSAIPMQSLGEGDAATEIVHVDHVSKSFNEKLAVDVVSLRMGTGSILALLGPNGAGKTTLTDMMRGDMEPDAGSIVVKGTRVHEDAQVARRNIGVCPQFDALDKITTRQQLQFYARIKGIKDVKRDVELVMRRVGLTEYASRRTDRLSGGNKRKLSLAIALLGNPTVLILDEPSSAMDAAAKRDMWKMLSSVTPGRSVLLTTHSMEEADELATSVAIMSGRILATGTSQELRKRYSNFYNVHLALSTAPGSTRDEMQAVESWARHVFPEASFDAVSLGGQVRFTMPAEDQVRRGKSTVLRLMETLEANKQRLGVAHYTVGMGTLETVFLNIMQQNNVLEESAPSEKVGKSRWRIGWPSGVIL
ncbi:hypothetical protein F5X68DRAFT_250381 [Plectosphaerella plurivora]|uniref:ABC transporter domain-containing protein n=1 Tax=Plectosphaerella plurivora TaxID=936078 RepID=A0A9P8VHJ4_9PEZI|nr:hypothetical protein F5X68DRAFT_250381 [Plectosphaerella plurivora]